MGFTELEKRALEVFVTSAEDPIYAVRHTLPPEVFGAFGSYFSRNPKDFREHLIDAILGQIEEERTNVSQEGLKWLADRDFREPSEAIEKGLAKSQDFFRRWYGKYSHKSIANTVWIPMVGTNVSQLFARELAYEQLAFFIEQSTRYVKWDADKLFLDSDIMNSSHAETFKSTLQHLIGGYHQLTEHAVEYYRAKNPFEEWLERQPSNIQERSDKVKKNAYNKQVQGAALDVSRFLLPQATRTNIAWILDARSTEFDIAAWKGHPLREIREAAELIEKHAGQIAPSLLKYTEKSDYYSNKLNSYGWKLRTNLTKPFGKGVDIISYDMDSLNVVLAHILKKNNVGGTFGQRYFELRTTSFQEKISILERVVKGRGEYDEWVEMDEEFDLVKATFEIKTDLGAIRDLRRHQKWDRSEPLYTTENGFYKPPVINKMHPEASRIFDGAVNLADETYRKIAFWMPHQAQYIVPMAAMHAITMSAGLDQIQYMLNTRTTPQGNFSYREDAFNLAEVFVRTHPWILGYEHYPEGKAFMQVYEEAPLKGLLNLQTGETALHT